MSSEQAANENQLTRLQRLQEMLDSGTMQHSGRLINALASGEIAHLLEGLPIAERVIVWRLVNEENAGDVLMELADDVRADLISRMEPEQLVAVSEGLDMDDLADLVQELPHYITREILASLDTQNRRRLEAVLSYPEDTAGGLMNPDTVTVRPEVTLDVVMRYLRLLKDKMPPHTDSLIVVNREGKYLGMLSLADLLTHDPENTVAEVMSLDIKAIPARWEDSQVAKRFERHDLLSAPVVDDDGRLLGRITVDDVVDLIREEGEHVFMGRAGLSEDVDMFAPVLVSARRRALWLGLNLITAFLASWVIGRFEATIEKMVALAVLMPIVASMGGIAGSQTLTLTIRGIALGQLSSKNARRLLFKEVGVGLLNGVIWAGLVAVVAGTWFDNSAIALLIGFALGINLLCAAFTGAVLPLLLKKAGIDPALAGGVLLTTVTDVVGFIAFLGSATLYLG
jgi:magnesium transporter